MKVKHVGVAERSAEGPTDPIEPSSGIEVRGVSKAFGSVHAVADVSFTVGEGEFCTLLGASGCGKTTTLRMIAGLERADAGVIHIRGRVVTSPNRYMPVEKRNVGFVFQAYALWPHMKVFDQVAYPLRVRSERVGNVADRVAEVLNTVGLVAEADRYPAELSGGQQQRVAFARALVSQPDVLLLDEPLSNLDAELRGQMRRELRRLHESVRVTTVYVTHDQIEALSLSDSIVLMDHGHVVEMGRPSAMYEHPRKRQTAMFIGGANSAIGTIVDLDGDSRARIQLSSGAVVTGMLGDERIEPGEAALLTVKPIDVRVDVGEGGNCVVATVLSRMYYGGHFLLGIGLEGVEWHAHWPRASRVEVGDSIRIAFGEESAFIFPVPPG